MTLRPRAGAALFRQFAAASRRGLALQEVATILAQDVESDEGERSLLSEIASLLAQGKALSNALQLAPQIFPEETTRWIALAEQKGALPAALDALAFDLDVREQGHALVRIALIWPSCLAFGVAVLFAVSSVFVMPAFRDAYASFGVELPLITRVTFAVMGGVLHGAWIWVPLLVLVGIGCARRRLPRILTAGLDGALDRIGFVRRFRVAVFVSRLVGILSAHQCDNGLRSAAIAHLAASASATSSARVAWALHSSMESGSSLSSALSHEARLPKRLSLYVQLGEKMNDLSVSLAQLSDFAAAELNEGSARFERGTLLSLYVLLGVAVGILVIAVYLPIFKLGALS